MLVDVAQSFPIFDLPFPALVFARLDEETRCALCGSTPLEPRASEAATLRWLQRHDPDAATRMLAAIANTGERSGFAGRSASEKEPREWRELRSQAVNDSQLTIALPLPEDVLEPIVAQFDEALDAFVPDAFSVPVCQRCFATAPANDQVVPLLIETYVNTQFDGNFSAARAQPSWPLVERFVAIVNAIAERSRRTG